MKIHDVQTRLATRYDDEDKRRETPISAFVYEGGRYVDGHRETHKRIVAVRCGDGLWRPKAMPNMLLPFYEIASNPEWPNLQDEGLNDASREELYRQGVECCSQELDRLTSEFASFRVKELYRIWLDRDVKIPADHGNVIGVSVWSRLVMVGTA